MSTAENKAIVRRLYEEVTNGKNLSLLDAVCTTDIILHDPLPLPAQGVEGFRQLLTLFLTAFPDHHVTIDVISAEGEMVSVLHTHRGTHRGTLMGIPPTGKQITVEGLELLRISGGKIAEFWRHDDDLGLMMQLGAVPAPGQGGR